MRRYDGVEAMLADARSMLVRLTAEEAYHEILWKRAILVDIRPAAQRERHGEVHEVMRPLVVERNVLEWRFDPRSDARLPIASYGARVLVLCQQGYMSSLAAASLQQLGIRNATDVVGGFEAWRAAALPVAHTLTPAIHEPEVSPGAPLARA